MRENERITNAFISFIYGDILSNKQLQQNIYINKKRDGRNKQWSYLSELFLIVSKCLIDNKKEHEVIIDEERLNAELDFWKHYITTEAADIVERINLGADYYKKRQYWDCKAGHGFSSVILFALANKNYSVAQKEAYKQILIFNRHPQVLLTGLLLTRTTHLLLENSEINQLELTEKLKEFLIHLQLSDLENHLQNELSNNYRVKFEREKINFILEIDSISLYNSNLREKEKLSSKNKLLLALNYYWQIVENGGICFGDDGIKKISEVSAIAYALYALNNETSFKEAEENKSWQFANEMSVYINKLRHFKVAKKRFEISNQNIDLFSLQGGDVVKHPVLNLCKIIEKRVEKHEEEAEVLIIVECKSGIYELK
ncbi:MAG: hypothetical protein ACLKAK_06010 [Alkaliphilus sp.]